MNFFDAKVTGSANDMKIEIGNGDITLNVPSDRCTDYADYLDKEVIFGLRPEDMFDPVFAPSRATLDERVRGKVDVLEPLGSEVYLYMVIGDNSFIARVDPRTQAVVSDEYELIFDMNTMHIFDPTTQEAIGEGLTS